MNAAPLNLLELKPVRNVGWETDPDGRAVLLIPKFRSALMQKWVLPLLAKPNFRVKLDAHGSYIWQQCDGQTLIGEIAEKMLTAFGPEIEPVNERIAAFIRKLEREAFLINTYKEPVQTRLEQGIQTVAQRRL
jgi:hypothetical protein